MPRFHYGSDWPFTSEQICEKLSTALDQTVLDEPLREMVYRDNTARLFGSSEET
jgi:hypothetical protein